MSNIISIRGRLKDSREAVVSGRIAIRRRTRKSTKMMRRLRRRGHHTRGGGHVRRSIIILTWTTGIVKRVWSDHGRLGRCGGWGRW
jgi:hypothetical protein